jgi:cytochrome c peroxidase
MCHIPEHGFTNNELSTPIGIAGRSLRRNAPTVLNAAYSRLLFHDGRQASLEGQAISPLVARDELGNPSPESVRAKIVGLGDYDGLFEEAFGVGPSLELVGKAVASWERTLLAGDSPFDRWRYGGDRNAFTPQQSRGFTIFVGKGRCASCHAIGEEYALFTDGAFHNTGIGFLRSRQLKELQSPVDVEIAPKSRIEVSRKVIGQIGRPRDTDLGRFEVTSDPKDKWRYRTPTLRNISLTAPYMHDGSMRTLADVVDFYNRGGATHEAIDPLIRPIGLDDTEMDSLIAFLEGLTARNLAELRADARSIPTGN